jgi:F0F1-type ATP synthase assembly protein I
VGLQFLFVFGAFLGLGYWLDGKWNTRPYLTIAGALLGAAAAFYVLYREVYGRTKDRNR